MDVLLKKQEEFNEAMARYEEDRFYSLFNYCISSLNVFMQICLFVLLFTLKTTFLEHLLLFFLAFVLADFINGLVHLYMDHNDSYKGFWGPFIANFHLHHLKKKYKIKPLWAIYFFESGSKVWLLFLQVVFLLFLVISHFLHWETPSSFVVLFFYFSVLSSVAEVSHYICHSVNSKFFSFLAKWKILLPLKHHYKHHAYDNNNYAFLNGMTDPLINRIAKKYYTGYKQNSDKHFAKYNSTAK